MQPGQVSSVSAPRASAPKAPTTNNPKEWVDDLAKHDKSIKVVSVTVSPVTNSAQIISEGPRFTIRAEVTCKVEIAPSGSGRRWLPPRDSPPLKYEATMPEGLSEEEALAHFKKVTDIYCSCQQAACNPPNPTLKGKQDDLTNKFAEYVNPKGIIKIQGLSDGSHTKLIAETPGSNKTKSIEFPEALGKQTWRGIKHIH